MLHSVSSFNITVGRLKSKIYPLHLVFIPPSTTAQIIKNAENTLHITLQQMNDVKICWPTFSKQQLWSQWIEAREPLVKRKFSFIDGKNYMVQEPGTFEAQNALYNGWLHCVFVTGTIAFGADGCIM